MLALGFIDVPVNTHIHAGCRELFRRSRSLESADGLSLLWAVCRRYNKRVRPVASKQEYVPGYHSLLCTDFGIQHVTR